MRDKALARLKRLVEHEARGAEAEASVIVGDPAEAIGRRAGESGAGLLVLGIHRPRPLLDMFRDSTMQRIVPADALPGPAGARHGRSSLRDGRGRAGLLAGGDERDPDRA